MSRINEVIGMQEYADQYGQGAELEKIYLMLKDISTTLALFYDELYVDNEENMIAEQYAE